MDLKLQYLDSTQQEDKTIIFQTENLMMASAEFSHPCDTTNHQWPPIIIKLLVTEPISSSFSTICTSLEKNKQTCTLCWTHFLEKYPSYKFSKGRVAWKHTHHIYKQTASGNSLYDSQNSSWGSVITWVHTWVGKIPLEDIATHSSTLAWRIPRDRGARGATVHGVPKELDTTDQLSTAH